MSRRFLASGGGSTMITRAAQGSYQIVFHGTGAIAADDDHVQVTTYGLTTNTCQIARWARNTVDITCFDLAGSAADTNFTRPSQYKASGWLAGEIFASCASSA